MGKVFFPFKKFNWRKPFMFISKLIYKFGSYEISSLQLFLFLLFPFWNLWIETAILGSTSLVDSNRTLEVRLGDWSSGLLQKPLFYAFRGRWGRWVPTLALIEAWYAYVSHSMFYRTLTTEIFQGKNSSIIQYYGKCF